MNDIALLFGDTKSQNDCYYDRNIVCKSISPIGYATGLLSMTYLMQNLYVKPNGMANA